MSSQYVLIEKSAQQVASSSVPNYIIHKIAEDMLLQTYALHLARIMSKVDPDAEYLIINLSHLAPSTDILVEMSPKALHDNITTAFAGNFVRRYDAKADGFQYQVATVTA